MNSVRADEFIQRALLDKRIPLVFLLEVIHDEFIKRVQEPRLCTGFIHQVNDIHLPCFELTAISNDKFSK